MALACFICSTALDRELDISSSCCNVCLYRTNAEDLNNAEDKIPTFKLHGVTGYLSLCYLTTERYKLQQVQLEQEKTRKQVLLNKATKATTQEQQESCYKTLEDLAHRKWSIAMAKVLFPIKWREKLARHALQIQSISELADELKPDCLLKTSVLWPCASKLVTLIVSAVGSVSTSGHSTVPVPKEKYYPDNSTLRSRCSEESNIQELKARPPLKELAPNINILFADPHPKQHRLPRKKNVQWLPYEVILDLDIQQNLLSNRREWPKEADRQRLPGDALLEVNEDLNSHENAPPKKRGRPRKTDLFVGGHCGTIVELKEQNLFKAKERVQKHNDRQ